MRSNCSESAEAMGYGGVKLGATDDEKNKEKENEQRMLYYGKNKENATGVTRLYRENNKDLTYTDVRC